MRIQVGEIGARTSGRVAGDAEVVVDGAAIDSRTLRPGALFVAIPADRDGHDFVGAAVAAGAGAVLVARDVAATVPRVVVDDTRRALAALGEAARDRMAGPVIGITGSVGKTTTKDLLAAVLGLGFLTTASERSFNNELGVPLTLLGARDDVEVVVVEMGARGRGHIAELSAIARPTIGVVTVVAAAHTELFGSVAEIAAAKGELVEALPTTGYAVLNADDAAVAAMAARTDASVLTFGEGGEVSATGIEVDDDLHPSFTLHSPWGTVGVRLAVAGRHQVTNALAAAAAALAAGADLEHVAEGLTAAVASPWRMEVTHLSHGGVLVNDAYNANPTSMAAALRALAELPAARRIAVVGEMAELGRDGAAAHLAISELAAELGIDLIAVDTDAYGVPATTRAEVVERLGDLADTALLIKASRASGLEVLVPLVAEAAELRGRPAR